MNILLTGGLGYIGSHTAAVLCAYGHTPVILDNCSNSKKGVIQKLQQITQTQIPFVESDIRDQTYVEELLDKHRIEAVIHFAGFKSVSESVQKPVEYYDNNVGGSISLVKAMINKGVKKLVFSSSATVYGTPQYLPIDENHPTQPVNPYGQSKLMVEQVLRDLAKTDPQWKIVALRYFNPIGAHPTGVISEEPLGKANNLMPRVIKVADTPGDILEVFGNDYPTPDGTGVRDYIHVMDLAEGHVAALKQLEKESHQFDVFNLGTGQGHSVLEMIGLFEKVTGRKVPFKIVPRRPGDVAECYAACEKAKSQLGWSVQPNRQLV